MMLSSGAHGMFPMLPLGITTITWSFQHCILAAVGFAVLCPLQWDQQRRQSPALPRDAGGSGVCAQDWCSLHTPRVQKWAALPIPLTGLNGS